jgi:site-specific DNA recombinase
MPSEVNSQTVRAALYARVSSDLQSTASIEDQLRICAEWAAKQGLLVAGSYTDQGISGASLIRPGIQKLLQDAAAGKFDIILTESLDRVSRDQEDIAHVYKRMRFLGTRIVTLSEGERPQQRHVHEQAHHAPGTNSRLQCSRDCNTG